MLHLELEKFLNSCFPSNIEKMITLMTEHEITMLQLKVTMLHLLQIARKKVVFQKLNIRIKKIWSTNYG